MTDKKYSVPAIDVFEAQDNFVVALDIPGADKEKIDVSVEENTLVVTAEVKKWNEEWKPLSREFELRDYQRKLRLSNLINVEEISAHYENGVLTLTLPKSEEAKPRKIDVKIAS